jgi:RNA polymerase sigma-70 factor, ECF subfamily
VAQSADEITLLLSASRQGERGVEACLSAVIYDDLRKLARRYMRQERPNHTLNSTALVHEAYLKLVTGGSSFEDRVHFFALASRVMRQILVDHARNHRAAKRGGGAIRLELADLSLAAEEERPEDVLAVDEALNRLAEFAPRQAKIVEMRFFGGMTAEEVAGHFNLSLRTVHRDWLLAKSWLFGQLRAK